MASSTNHAVSGNQCLYNNINLVADSAVIKSGNGVIYGFTVNSHTSGVVQLFDNTSATGQVMFGSMTLGSGERYVNLGGVCFGSGCAVLTTGTVNLTMHYR